MNTKANELMLPIKGINLSIRYQYTPEIPGVYDLNSENCYVTEDSNIDILSIRVPYSSIDIADLLSTEILDTIGDYIRDFESEVDKEHR